MSIGNNCPQEILKIVEKIKEGDVNAFGELYDIFITPLYRYLYYRVPKDEVDDLVEMVFIKVWKNIGKYKVQEKANFSAWFYKIANNEICNFFRKHKEVYELDYSIKDESEEADPALLINRDINKDLLYMLLDNLKDSYKEVLILKYVNELSNKEIAEVLDITEAYARQLQFRALSKLKEVVKEKKVQF